MQFGALINDLQVKSGKAFSELEVVTKNITNATTPGYKAERPISFDDIIDDSRTQRNMEAGKLSITNRPNDVSLEGKGFFVLLDNNDETVLTRNLNLGTDKDGYLKSGENLVFPKVKVPEGFSDLEIAVDGSVLGKRPDGSQIKITDLQVVNYPAADKLDFDGSVYKPTDEAGKSLHVCLGPTSQTRVRQGALEGSNVNGPKEFAIFRQMNQKISTYARITQLLNTSQREYVRTLTGALG
ncbi:MAG: flagellar hook basal-body protein [Candidatus Caenarcaniphilales bacterium]|nr:flagellar hook basal-body protein [Candidatus Caenarcaniphilales bacterium]